MPSPQDTAYPRLRQNPSPKELEEIYTPTVSEINFAKKRTRQPAQQACLLLLLKTFQCLGYFIPYKEIPVVIIQHIIAGTEFLETPEQMEPFATGKARRRHMAMVREFLGVTAYDDNARNIIIKTSQQATKTRDDLPDIINRSIEELIRHRYELPAFSTFLRIARTTRNQTNRAYQALVCQCLDEQKRQQLQKILVQPEPGTISRWEQIKREPKRASIPQFKEFLNHLHWLQEQNIAASAFHKIPEAKIRQFEAEARSLDLSSINDMTERKRLTLLAALILKQVARTLDDSADLFIRLFKRMDHKASDALALYREQNAERTDTLIAQLREITLTYKMDAPREQRMSAIESLLEEQGDQILAQCNAHSAIAGNNHLSFLPKFYSSCRSTFFLFLENVQLVSTSQDTSLIEAIELIRTNNKSRSEWFKPTTPPNLSFLQDRWWVLVTGQKDKHVPIQRLHRRFLELAIFNQVRLELKSGDLCIPGSNQFSDYRLEFISESEYKAGLELYGEQAGIPVQGKPFVETLCQQLKSACKNADNDFPDNTYLQIKNGKPSLKRLRAKPDPTGLRVLEQLHCFENLDQIDLESVFG